MALIAWTRLRVSVASMLAVGRGGSFGTAARVSSITLAALPLTRPKSTFYFKRDESFWARV